MTASFLEFALGYAADGLRIFPLHYIVWRDGRPTCSCGNPECANPGKHPYSRLAARGCLSATSTDIKHITFCWDGVDFNIGVATGEGSGIVVLDVDPRHGGDESLSALARQHGPLPHTVQCLTGGGGVHIYFRYPGPVKNSASLLGAGLDIRGDGGYVVAPPSTHISGGSYAWDVDAHPDDTPLADMPAWMMELLIERPGKAKAAELPENWRRLAAEGVAEGQRNNAIARICGHLLRRHVDPYVTRDLCLAWNQLRCRPPLGEDEAVSVIDSIVKRERARRERRA